MGFGRGDFMILPSDFPENLDKKGTLLRRVEEGEEGGRDVEGMEG